MSVLKRGNKWQYDFWVNGKRYRGSIPEARVKAQAERAEIKIRDSVYEGTYGKRVVAPKLRGFFADTYLPWAKTNKRTWREDVYRSKSILEFFGRYRLNEISPMLIERFKIKRCQMPTKRNTERRPATVNRELENLSSMFTFAIDHGLLQSNPCRKVRLLSEDNERNRYLSEEEESRLMDVLHGRRAHLRSIVVIDLQTGLRKQELLRLRWANVDFARSLINVMNSKWERTKTGKGRSVPMTTLSRDELLALRTENGDGEYVFVNKNTKMPLTDVKRAFATALRKAKIEDFHFHDLRHTCATRLGDRGASAFEIAQIMGWTDIRMAMRYTHATGDGLRRAMQLLVSTVGTMKTVESSASAPNRHNFPHNRKNGQHGLPVSV